MSTHVIHYNECDALGCEARDTTSVTVRATGRQATLDLCAEHAAPLLAALELPHDETPAATRRSTRRGAARGSARGQAQARASQRSVQLDGNLVAADVELEGLEDAVT